MFLVLNVLFITGLVAFIVVGAWYIIRRQRQYRDFDPSSANMGERERRERGEREWNQWWYVGKVAGIGWAMHYSESLCLLFATMHSIFAHQFRS
jgi:hypothetical protein